MSRSRRSSSNTAKAADKTEGTKADAPDPEASEPAATPPSEMKEPDSEPPAPGPVSRVAAPPQPTEDDRRAAAKRPQDRVSTKERSDRQAEADAVKQELLQARSLLQQAKGRIGELEREVGHLRLAPGRAIPMSPVEVREQVERAHGRCTFRVLGDYSHMGAVMPKGRELDARHYPRLMDHVSNGLQLVLIEKPEQAAAQTR